MTKPKTNKPSASSNPHAGLASAIAQGLRDGLAGDKAPDSDAELAAAIAANPTKDVLVEALRTRAGGRVVLKRGSAEIDVNMTAAFLAHLRVTKGTYTHPKYMGQRVKLLSEVTTVRPVSDPFYAAAGLERVALADGVNPVSGVKYPVDDPDALERVAFVAKRIRVDDPSDPDEVQPIVDMVTGEEEPKRKVAEALDDFNDLKRDGDEGGEIAAARQLLSMDVRSPTGAAEAQMKLVDSAAPVGRSAASFGAVTEVVVYDKLVKLSHEQIDELLLRLGIPSHYIAPSTNTTSKRAMDIIQYVTSQGLGLTVLARALRL